MARDFSRFYKKQGDFGKKNKSVADFKTYTLE
jgi:hypothetical protein